MNKDKQTVQRLKKALEEEGHDLHPMRGSAGKVLVKQRQPGLVNQDPEVPALPDVVHSTAVEAIQVQTRERLRKAVMGPAILQKLRN